MYSRNTVCIYSIILKKFLFVSCLSFSVCTHSRNESNAIKGFKKYERKKRVLAINVGVTVSSYDLCSLI